MSGKQPIILAEGNFTREELVRLKAGARVWETVDIYADQIRELAEITYPSNANTSERERFVKEHAGGDLGGSWIYYPWSGVLLHCVGDAGLRALRTNRNQNVITHDEQEKLGKSTVAVAGMSVGSGIALSCVYSGISDVIKLADFDRLETANLNRLREGLASIGQKKVELAARHIYEVNPYAQVQLFESLDVHTLDPFFLEPAADVIVDEIDDFKMKVQLRLKAKELKVPVLMFTSLGDNILIDVERYDLDNNLAIFNGAVGAIPDEILSTGAITTEDAKRYAVKLVGTEYVPTRAMESLLAMGTTLVGRPQLYSTVAVDGGLAAYVIRQIVLGAPLPSGRYFVRFSELLDMPSGDLADSARRKEALSQLLSKK